MQESTVRHCCQLNKLKSLKVQNHSVFCSCAIIMATQYYYLVATDERASFCLHTQWELNVKHSPAVMSDVVLLDAVDTTTAFITTEHIDIRVFKNDSWHGASFLVEFCDRLPAVLRDTVPLATLQNSVYTATSNSVDVVPLMG